MLTESGTYLLTVVGKEICVLFSQCPYANAISALGPWSCSPSIQSFGFVASCCLGVIFMASGFCHARLIFRHTELVYHAKLAFNLGVGFLELEAIASWIRQCIRPPAWAPPTTCRKENDAPRILLFGPPLKRPQTRAFNVSASSPSAHLSNKDTASSFSTRQVLSEKMFQQRQPVQEASELIFPRGNRDSRLGTR